MLAGVRIIAAIALLASPAFAATHARPQIKDDAEIFHRLLVTAVANEIREKCDTIDARSFAATFYVLGILRLANSHGFSRAEITAYKKNESEQNRLRRAGYAYLDSHGVDRKNPASFCTLGQAEIAAGSEIGKLIKRTR